MRYLKTPRWLRTTNLREFEPVAGLKLEGWVI